MADVSQLEEDQRRALDRVRPLVASLEGLRSPLWRARVRSLSRAQILTYFGDAEADAVMPLGLTAEKWEQIKAWLVDHVREALSARL
jgi:hypothetical protein